MGKKSKFSIQKNKKLYYNEILANCIYEQFKVDRYVLNKWFRRYHAHGIVGLDDSKGWANYSKELKKQAVLDALNGLPILDILNKYDISTHSTLYKWIKLYNSHKELKNSGGKLKLWPIKKIYLLKRKLKQLNIV